MSNIALCPLCGNVPESTFHKNEELIKIWCCGIVSDSVIIWNQYSAAMKLATAEVNSLKAYRVPLERIDAALEAADDMVEQARIRVLEVF